MMYVLMRLMLSIGVVGFTEPMKAKGRKKKRKAKRQAEETALLMQQSFLRSQGPWNCATCDTHGYVLMCGKCRIKVWAEWGH